MSGFEKPEIGVSATNDGVEVEPYRFRDVGVSSMRTIVGFDKVSVLCLFDWVGSGVEIASLCGSSSSSERMSTEIGCDIGEESNRLYSKRRERERAGWVSNGEFGRDDQEGVCLDMGFILFHHRSDAWTSVDWPIKN
ncbi:hypothetical protein U1Q18_041144 [Sarracenia purpurea var. burkii]